MFKGHAHVLVHLTLRVLAYPPRLNPTCHAPMGGHSRDRLQIGARVFAERRT